MPEWVDKLLIAYGPFALSGFVILYFYDKRSQKREADDRAVILALQAKLTEIAEEANRTMTLVLERLPAPRTRRGSAE